MWPKISVSLQPYLRQNASKLALTVGVGVLNSAVMLLLPLTVGRYYELLLGGTSNRAQLLNTIGLGTNLDWQSFWVIFLGLIACRGLLEYVEFRLTGGLNEGLAKHLRERVFAQQLGVQIETHREKSVGKYLLRYAGDFQSVRRYLRVGIIGFLRDVLFVALALTLLFWLNAPITACLVAGLLPFLLLFAQINRQMERITRQRRDQRSANLSFVQSSLVGLATIKVFNREPVENERFESRSKLITNTNLAFLKWRSLLEALLPVALFSLVALVLAGVQWQQSVVSGGSVVTFILAVLSLRPVLRRLLRVGSVWKSGRLSLDKLDAFFAQPVENDTSPIFSESILERLPISNGTVEFKAVTFGYNPQQPVLRELSFRSKTGGICWIKGLAKSSVFRLLTKQYEPQSGQILIDGQPIARFSAKAVRKRVALISDELPLLGRTVFEAVSYSRKSERRPVAAALLTQIQTLANVPHKLTIDTKIGDDGSLLSKGQRTVLLWVRALLTNKPILLLDDPFSGISPQGSAQLLRWLEEIAHNKTILLATSTTVESQQQSVFHNELSH
jgi:ABC-type multidrug transport system fused ATPase/permease subunit